VVVARSTAEVVAVDGEGAVRLYLMWLENPEQLVDRTVVERLEREIGSTADPVARLRLLGQLERAQVADEAQLEADFVRLAGRWAEENEVPASAFRQMGVSDEVLDAAGLVDGANARRRGSRGGRGGRQRTAREASPRGAERPPRAKPVSREALQSWMLEHAGPFTVAHVTEAVGGSPMTVKKVVDELVQAGQLQWLGPVSDWRGRGRAPSAYQSVATGNGKALS
jgi:hypothetical protein